MATLRSGRLLIGVGGERPDPGLIRFASMVARLQAARLQPARLQPARPLRAPPLSLRPEPVALADDPEVRFVLLAPRNHNAALARAMLRKQVTDYFTAYDQALPVGCDVLKGNVVERLAELAADFDSDLVLVGPSGWSPTMSCRLAMQAPCSVWLVPPDWAPVLRHLLVPVDFSDRSAETLRLAIDLARRAHAARCIVLHVYPPRLAGCVDPDFRQRRLHDECEAFLSRIDAQGVRLEPMLEECPRLATAIARTAKTHGADLIVMATRGRSRLAGLLLPSATAQAIRCSAASFLVLKRNPPCLGLLAALRERLHQGEELQFS